MRLRYRKQDGTMMELELGENPITLGRTQEADLVLLDEKVSRIHCGIRLWDGEFYIKDLKSRNGTYVNGEKVEVSKLRAGDVIRVGSTEFHVESDTLMGSDTAFREIKDQMDLGKGYTTILRQIVDDTDEKPRPVVLDASAPAAEAPSSPAASGKRLVVKSTQGARKPMRITIKKQ